MKKINIDSVAMIRKIRDNLYLETKDMNADELIEYYSKSMKHTDANDKKKSKLKAA